MYWIAILFKCFYILLGVVVLIIGRFMPPKLCMPKETKWTITDTIKYIKACRNIFYAIAGFYIVFGIILFVFSELSHFPIVISFSNLIPCVIAICLSARCRKYMRLNEFVQK